MPRHILTPDEARRGGQRRAAQPTAPAARLAGGQARAAQPGFVAHQANRGKRGYAATVALYGPDFALAKIAAWQAAHPPTSEVWLHQLLESWGYERDATYYVQVPRRVGERAGILDVLVFTAGGPLAIQPGAARWHDAAADAAFDAALEAEYAIPTLRLDSEQIRRHPAQARLVVFRALRAIVEGRELAAPATTETEERVAA